MIAPLPTVFVEPIAGFDTVLLMTWQPGEVRPADIEAAFQQVVRRRLALPAGRVYVIVDAQGQARCRLGQPIRAALHSAPAEIGAICWLINGRHKGARSIERVLVALVGRTQVMRFNSFREIGTYLALQVVTGGATT